MADKTKYLKEKYEDMKEEGLTWTIRNLEGPSQPHVTVDGKECIMLASNNYLDLANHPRLREAGKKAIEDYGAGAGSDWSIAGTMDIHEELWDRIADFKNTGAGMTYQTGFAVNAGLVPQLAGKGDVLISDELNHGSIIDGIMIAQRMFKADKMLYSHSDMGELEECLKKADEEGYDNKIVLTDGVFSMDGDIAKMDEIQELANEYGALTYVDDAHGEGVLGGGHGIAKEFNVEDDIDIQMGTFSKAFGGFGGMLAGTEHLINYAYNTSRSWLLSAAFPPHVAAINIEALDIVEEEGDRVEKLWDLTDYFKKELESIGFDTGFSETPIVPAMIGDSKKCQKLADRLYEEGIFGLAIVYPMVAKGKARIRNQINAGLTKDDLNEVLRVYEKLGKELDLV
ncbi:MAG: aminotransferase class I/II-fold pyridoxal phosphate-dependent enzyme [Candidatus Thermoplasmatota archaeon]|nr:aminotransferase class I/II-fold pyridoxal phosphate-dependent enzyme [Candidatus Thermoplasmatota archaeon]